MGILTNVILTRLFPKIITSDYVLIWQTKNYVPTNRERIYLSAAAQFDKGYAALSFSL